MTDSFIGRAWYDDGREYDDRSWGHQSVEPFIVRINNKTGQFSFQTNELDEVQTCIKLAINEFFCKRLGLNERMTILADTNKKIHVILRFYLEEV